MKLQNEKYTILTSVEVKPSFDDFDAIHNTENTDIMDFHMARVLRIERYDGHTIKVALVDLTCSSCEPCAVLEDNILTVILSYAILRIDLDTGMIVQYKECDNMGGLFEIHPFEDGYIIWGEGEIFRYNMQLNQIWWFAGRDILVSQAGTKSFWIENDLIHCCDWQGWHYVLDINGKLIRDTHISETL